MPILDSLERKYIKSGGRDRKPPKYGVAKRMKNNYVLSIRKTERITNTNSKPQIQV